MTFCVLYCVWTPVYWDLFLFISGALLAELHFIRSDHKPGYYTGELEHLSHKVVKLPASYVRTGFSLLNFTPAPYVLSIASHPTSYCKHTPAHRVASSKSSAQSTLSLF